MLPGAPRRVGPPGPHARRECGGRRGAERRGPDPEPGITPGHPPDEQSWLIQTRADAQAARDADEARGEDTQGWDDELSDLDEQINEAGMRGNVLPTRTQRRHRSTRRRQDA